MPKIVEIIPALAWGGAEIFCINLCNEFIKDANNSVTLISMYDHNPDLLPVSLLDERIKLITLGKKSGPHIKIIRKLFKTINRIQPDIVHTHLHTGYYTLYSALKLRRSSVRFFHTFHNPVKKESPKWAMRRIYEIFFRTKIITPVSTTKEVLEGAKKEYGKNSATDLIHCNTIPLSATPEFENIKQKIASLKKNIHTKVFLNVARIAKQKNQHLLLDCMKTLEEENENTIAVFIGNTTEKNAHLYKELLEAKPNNVHFLGRVSNVGDYLLNADALVLTSLYEALPIALQEAFSVGLIPICTPVGGMLETITEETGFLAKDTSHKEFVKTLKRFIQTDAKVLQQLKANGKKLFQKQLHIEICASKYQELFSRKSMS